MSFIDEFYDVSDKSNFYIGLVSKIFQTNSVIQVENLSLLTNRKERLESIYPGSINYNVVVDNHSGLLIGKVYQSQVKSTDSVHDNMYSNNKDKIFPEISFEIVGIISHDRKFSLPGNKNADIGNKVYYANSKIISKCMNSSFYKSHNGKSLDKIAYSLDNKRVNFNIDVNSLFNRHLMIVGATNSGKSTTSLKIIDELLKNNVKLLIIDPTGEYNKTFKNNTNIEKIALGSDTFFPINRVKMNQWVSIFGANGNSQSAALYKAIKSLRYKFIKGENGNYKKEGLSLDTIRKDMNALDKDNHDHFNFNLSLLPKQIENESVRLERDNNYHMNYFDLNTNSFLKEKIEYVLDNSSLDKFFSADIKNESNLIYKLDNFVDSGKNSLYIDASELDTTDSIGYWIVDFISSHLINKKIEDIKNPFVIFIDEAHRYINNNHNLGLELIAREGRKKGIFLFITTQNPSDIPETIIGQIGSLIAHRLTNSNEIEILKNHLSVESINKLKRLTQGQSILSSINLVNDIPLCFYKSSLVHNNDTREL